ncbi:MAG: sulfite exporter TauE/SafE family protein [bacterium]
MDINLIPLIVGAFLSYLSAAFAGFGGILIPIALGAAFYSIEWMLAVLVPLTLLSNGYILVRHYRNIDTTILFRKILPYMGIGLFVGILTFNRLHGALQETIFGVLVVFLSVRELYLLLRRGEPSPPLGGLRAFLYIFSAGIIHGMYASGGPLLVYVLNKFNLEKSVFRSTISAVWLILSVFLTSSYVITDRLTPATLHTSLLMLPSLVSGLLLGEYLHRKSNGRTFKLVVFALLLFSGLSIVFK